MGKHRNLLRAIMAFSIYVDIKSFIQFLGVMVK